MAEMIREKDLKNTLLHWEFTCAHLRRWFFIMLYFSCYFSFMIAHLLYDPWYHVEVSGAVCSVYGVREGKPRGEGGRTTGGKTVARTRALRERDDTHA